MHLALKTTILAAAVLLAGWAGAQDFRPRDVPGEGSAEFEFESARDVRGWAPDDSPILLDVLHKLVVTGSEPETPIVQRGALTLQGVTVRDLDALADELAQWISRPLTETGLDRLTEVILRHYDEHDRPVNEVAIPPQEAANGELRVQVFEGRIGQVGIGRLRYFGDKRIQRGIHIQEGALLYGSAVQADLDWLSRNPFRRATLFAAPGEGVAADLLIQIDERRPWRIYAGYDNSGTDAVGENRWFTGFNWGNAFGLDQLLGYQFTVGDSIDEFQAHAVTWEIPFHATHKFVRFSAGWSEANANEVISSTITSSEGSSWQVSALFGSPLRRIADWKHDLQAGLDFKRADNFFLFGDDSLPGTDVDIVQFRADWNGERAFGESTLDLAANLVASPGNLTARNDEDHFEAFRTGADPTYIYARLGATWEHGGLDSWSSELRGTTQLASGALLPTEQLALGGHATVRGYSERILLADSGYALSAELRTPAFIRELPAVGPSFLRGIAFLDHGLGWKKGAGAESLTGAGIGFRLRLGTTGEGRLDLAIPLEGDHDPIIHTGWLLSF